MHLVLSGAKRTTLAPLSHSLGPFLRVAACGICYSDRKAYHCPPSGMKFPRVLGHEVWEVLSVDFPEQRLPQGDRLLCGQLWCVASVIIVAATGIISAG